LFQIKKPFKISRTAITALARNCPNLLRITKSNITYGAKAEELDGNFSIIMKRINGNGEFRRVHRPAGMENFKNLDYDSMDRLDSCSDEDDSGIWEFEYKEYDASNDSQYY
jgi:hypothetical protein